MKEEEMKNIVKDYFENQGFVGFEEISVGQKRIDLYFIHRNYPKTVAVELKIRKWKQVLRQAYQNSFYAQKTYVGLWHECLSDDVVSEIESYGLGILEVKLDDVKLVKKPDNKFYGILPSTQRLIDKIASGNADKFLWSKIE